MQISGIILSAWSWDLVALHDGLITVGSSCFLRDDLSIFDELTVGKGGCNELPGYSLPGVIETPHQTPATTFFLITLLGSKALHFLIDTGWRYYYGRRIYNIEGYFRFLNSAC